MRPVVQLLKNNEEGYALVVTMLMLTMLTVIGIAATNTSTMEVQISGNAKKIVEDFYVAEASLLTTLERTDWWLDDDFFLAGEADSNWSGKVDFDEDKVEDALVEVRCIVNSGTYKSIEGLSVAANDIPKDNHIGPPTVNSGYSLRYFVTRKYSVTSTALRAATDLQSGVWKIFNRF